MYSLCFIYSTSFPVGKKRIGAFIASESQDFQMVTGTTLAANLSRSFTQHLFSSLRVMDIPLVKPSIIGEAIYNNLYPVIK